MSICGHNADTTPAVKKVTKVYHTVVQFLKNNLIQLYSLVYLHIHTYRQSNYVLRHRAYRGNIYYCGELDNETNTTRWLWKNNRMGGHVENIAPTQ